MLRFVHWAQHETLQEVQRNSDKFWFHRFHNQACDNFIKQVDIGMVRDSAIASKKANISQFNLLTSSGANANMPANDWKMFHGLLYLKSKGEIENIVKDIGFERTSIFRPGLLNRGKRARWTEQLFHRIMPSTVVQDVAKAMIYDAESTSIEAGKVEKAVVYEAKDIKDLVKEKTA